MTQTDELVRRLPTEMGGLDAGPIQRVEHEYAPWEKRCHALANVLDIHKIISTEEKRRGVEGLGSEMAAKLTYYGGGSWPSPTSSSRNRSSRPRSWPGKWMK